MLLKKTQLAHALGRHAARGDVGDGTRSEIEARMSDIHLVGQDGYADRFYFRDRRIHERQQDVQVMNHDVIHYVNIQAARREYAETVNFKVKRVIQRWHHRDDSGIESFQVADLQNPVYTRRRGNKLVGLRERSGHRFFHDNVYSEFEQTATDARVFNGGHGHACGIHASGKRFNVRENFRREFLCDLLGARNIGIHDADQLRAFQFAIHASMVPAEIACAYYGDAYFLKAGSKRSPFPFLTGSKQSPFPFPTVSRRIHCFPCVSGRSATPMSSSGNASIAMPAASAASMTRARSNSRVRPASMASAETRHRCITSTVCRPTTGTSNRMSCLGLLTFTTMSVPPSAMRAARSIVSSVPSMASTATQARSRMTTVCPRSSPAIWRAISRPYAMSAVSRASGARRVSTPAAGISGLRNVVESTSSMPSHCNTPATAPISESVFLRGSENSSFASFQSGRIELKILLCFTCPAIMARLTPSLCIKSMVLLNSPRLTQCSRVAILSSSADASSFNAITAMSIPWLRAPSSTRNGKRPFPAMSPHPVVVVFASAMTSAVRHYC